MKFTLSSGLVACSFFAAASSHAIRHHAHGHGHGHGHAQSAASSCYTVNGVGGAAINPLPTVHKSVVSTVTVTAGHVARSTTSLGAPTLATSTVVKTSDRTSHHHHRGEFATTTLLVHTTITLTAPASVITEIANASTYTFGTASFATDAVTIPIPSGFVPIESTLPTAGVAKRHIAERAADPPAGHQTIFPAGIRPEGAPKSVVCNTVIHSTVTVTSTTTAIVKKLAAGTKTATSELTVTQLHHNFPNHPGKTITKTSIISITSHTTPLTTVTTTPTVTVTDVLPEATFYAACAANNLVSQVNDYPVDGFALAATSISDQQTSNIVQYTDVNATSSYDCCVMAQQTTDSTVFFYTGSDFGVQNGQCLVFISDACPVPGDQTEIYGAVYNGTASQLGGDYHAYMGNAGCGVGVTSATNFTIWTQAQSLGLEGGGVTAGSQAGTQLTNAG